MKARGETRKLLIVIGELQSLIGTARALHENDRDPMGYTRGQNALSKAFELCLDATSRYEPIVVKEK